MKQKYMIVLVVLGLFLLVGQAGPAAAWTRPAPPVSPTNLTAKITPGATTHTLTLNWTAGAGATGYTIHRIDWTSGKKIFTVKGGTISSHVQTGLAKGSTYRVRIRANSFWGSSAWSPILEINTP